MNTTIQPQIIGLPLPHLLRKLINLCMYVLVCLLDTLGPYLSSKRPHWAPTAVFKLPVCPTLAGKRTRLFKPVTDILSVCSRL